MTGPNVSSECGRPDSDPVTRDGVGGRARAWELLVLCARPALTPEQERRVGGIIREGVPWEQLLALGRRHRTVPFLLRHLGTLAEPGVPSEILDALRTDVALNAAHSRSLVGTLREILLEFDARGIEAFPYKGPVLAQLLYGDPAFRQMTDLDLLVRRGDVSRAVEVLGALGYGPRHNFAPRQQRALLRADNNLPLRGAGGRPSVELHWAFAARHPLAALDLDELLPGAGEIQLAGMSMPTFGPEDLLLVLCFHGSRHMWERLAWLCDIAELSRSHAIDSDRLVARARRFRSERVLLLGLSLAEEVLDARLPPQMSERVRADFAVQEISARVRAIHADRDDRPAHSIGLPYHLFQVRAMDRWECRLRYGFHAATTPTPEDWEVVLLPDRLFSLYYVIRPLRLAVAYGIASRTGSR